jgi:hypothetical protein
MSRAPMVVAATSAPLKRFTVSAVGEPYAMEVRRAVRATTVVEKCILFQKSCGEFRGEEVESVDGVKEYFSFGML